VAETVTSLNGGHSSNDNTKYHYQDNRVEYFLASGNQQNIVDYASAGVIGLLFGSGQEADTNYMDYARDGITNPSAVGNNTLLSSYADDDGGFLRIRAGAYYSSGPVPIQCLKDRFPEATP
jgi:hypothetical protein